ncbi:MAG: hypothetical protein OJF51_000136 [Nitrospira sp.]|nr:MAG: hypothetical protein OJF51_000136 [Nitrospira sp.]
MTVSPNHLQNFLQWRHNPLARAAVLYVTGVIGVLVFSYFVTRSWY